MIGVLLLNLGGPATPADVEPFLRELFSDRELIELPFGAAAQPYLAWLIAKLRGPAVRRNYAGIGGGSPQLRLTEAQAGALQARLDPEGGHFHVAIGMRYARPSVADALERFVTLGARRIVTLPLYPQYSAATTGSSDRAVARTLTDPRFSGRFEVAPVVSYPTDPSYLAALADNVRRALDGFPEPARGRVVLLFSAHGLPQRFVDRGDPYVTETEATVAGILALLKLPNRNLLAYQSRTGPVRWIGPGTDHTIKQLAREGVREILVVPVSFVTDHIETLYEIDQLFAREARRAGISDFRRSAALDTHPLFIEALARQVEGALA
jgi:ferrochelatase